MDIVLIILQSKNLWHMMTRFLTSQEYAIV